jgi:hypothetical protein
VHGVSGSHARILKPILSIDNHTLYLRYIAYCAGPDRCYWDALSLLDSQQVDAKIISRSCNLISSDLDLCIFDRLKVSIS